MDHHLAMVRATGLRSAMVGSEVGVGSWATGEYDEMEIAVSCPDGRGRALFRNVFSSSSLAILRIFCDDFSTFWNADMVRYNTFVEEQY